MMRVLHYYSRFEQARGGFGALPSWARFLLGILAIPGIALALLGIVMLGAGVLLVLMLTLPVYRLSKRFTDRTSADSPDDMIEAEVVSRDEPVAPRRPIEVKILEH